MAKKKKKKHSSPHKTGSQPKVETETPAVLERTLPDSKERTEPDNKEFSSKLKPWSRTVRVAGSLTCGITIMAILLVVLAWATFIENGYSTRVVQYAVYGSWWFELLLGILGFNLLCSALARWPWKKRHIPFLIAHLGIIILLVGCFVTARFGEEAQISIHEGEMGRYAVKFQDEEIAFSTTYFNQPEKRKPEEKKVLISKSLDPLFKHKTTLLEEQTKAFEEYDLTSIPVQLGPFNWEEYLSKSWFSSEHPYQYSLYLPLKLQKRSKGTIYDRDDVKIEILDYYADSTLKPVVPLKIQTLWTRANEEEMRDWETFELPLNTNADSMENRMYRQFELFTKTDSAKEGERISFRLAKNMTETAAFQEIRSPESLGTYGTVVIRAVGENHSFSMDELYGLWKDQAPKVEENRIKIRDTQRKLSEEQSRLIALMKDEKADSTEIELEMIRLEKEIENLKSDQETLANQVRQPIGETGLTLELIRLMPQSLAAVFQIRAKDGTSQSLYLFADAPENNIFCNKFGIAGVYLIDSEALGTDAEGLVPPMTLERTKMPRLELMQGANRNLYYRFWSEGRIHAIGEITDFDKEHHFADQSGNGVTLKINEFAPQDLPGLKIEPLPFNRQKPGTPVPTPRVLIQATVEGNSEQFWLKRNESMVFSPEIGEIGHVTGKTKTVSVVFPYTQLDLGFCLYLRKFERTYDPGTRTVVHYASQLDLYDINDIHGSPLERERIIQMNQPGMFRDQTTGRKYRVYQSSYSGPFSPGDSLYDSKIAGLLLPLEQSPRDKLYASTLSVNYDPGRGLKYLGCLMIVLGSFWLLWGKRRSS